MNETGKSLWGKLGLLIGLAILCHPVAGADRVYKCVEGGKTRFTSNPGEAGRNCQPLELHVPQPDPAEVARQAEKNRAEAAREKAEAARLREVIKNDPDALSQARRMEMAKSLARQPVPGRRGRRKRVAD